MEFLPKNEILEFHPDTLQVVRKMYGLDKPGEMREAIHILEAWIQQQNHFVKKDFSRDLLERMIIAAKGSIERAKGRLDKLCTLRTLIPHMFGDYDVRKDFKMVHDANIKYAFLPKLTPKHERIYFIKNAAKTQTSEILLNGFRLCAMLVEYLKANDYAASYIFVVDLTECNITDFVTKVGIMDLRNLTTMLIEGYGLRVSAIHLLTNHKIIDTFVLVLKQVMSAKLGERVQVHRSLESLHQYVPKDILPAEYGDGGESRTLNEICEKWLDVLSSKEYREHHRSMNAACTDERLRQTDKFNEQYMGMPGTFRNLTVD